eukprot:TRINITY_DN105670_c0_g1_i1.p1 TRINITY_DN105670_c0_g1~~TRINITY_DN105670_c0_g1_i1.p1  ORF type:complete len:452 (+),score=84.66 TRINITY_DN105670_c0_g1_i1:11-1366(+)
MPSMQMPDLFTKFGDFRASAFVCVAILACCVRWCTRRRQSSSRAKQISGMSPSAAVAFAAAQRQHRRASETLDPKEFRVAFEKYDAALKMSNSNALVQWHKGICQIDYGDVTSGVLNMTTALHAEPQDLDMKQAVLRLRAANDLVLMRCDKLDRPGAALQMCRSNEEASLDNVSEFLSAEWDGVFSARELAELDVAAESAANYLNSAAAKTFWLPEGHAPRNAIEAAIARLRPFAEHAFNATNESKDIASSWLGCEYWVRVQTNRRGVAIHYDMDVPAKQRDTIFLPAVSSILYLGSDGEALLPGPTVILSQRPSYAAGVVSHEPAVPRRGKFIWPRRGRYAVFPGNLHHGVMPSNDDGRRVTVLVNWWRDHRPQPPSCVLAPDGLPGMRLDTEVKPLRCNCQSVNAQAEESSPLLPFLSRLGFLRTDQALRAPCCDGPAEASGVLQVDWF